MKCSRLIWFAALSLTAAGCTGAGSVRSVLPSSKDTLTAVSTPTLPTFASASLHDAYVVADSACKGNAGNAELFGVRELVPIGRTDYIFSCDHTKDILIDYYSGSTTHNTPLFLAADRSEEPIQLDRWNISSQTAEDIAQRREHEYFQNVTFSIVSADLFDNTVSAADSSRPFEWEIRFVTSDFNKKLNVFIDANDGAVIRARQECYSTAGTRPTACE